MLKKTLLSLPSEERAQLNLDSENPRSLYNLLPHVLKEKVDTIDENVLQMDEADLVEYAFGGPEPDGQSNRLRIALWEEYDRCQRLNAATMDFYRITKGNGGMWPFYNRWSNSRAKLAWVLKPPVDYETKLSELHQLGLRQLEHVIKSKPVMKNKDGEQVVDHKMASLQFEIYKHIDVRLKGAVVQRIDQRTLNINANANPNSQQQSEMQKTAQLSMEEINERLASLESESRHLSSPTQRVRLEVGVAKKVTPAEAELVEEERRAESRRERGVN